MEARNIVKLVEDIQKQINTIKSAIDQNKKATQETKVLFTQTRLEMTKSIFENSEVIKNMNKTLERYNTAAQSRKANVEKDLLDIFNETKNKRIREHLENLKKNFNENINRLNEILIARKPKQKEEKPSQDDKTNDEKSHESVYERSEKFLKALIDAHAQFQELCLNSIELAKPPVVEKKVVQAPVKPAAPVVKVEQPVVAKEATQEVPVDVKAEPDDEVLSELNDADIEEALKSLEAQGLLEPPVQQEAQVEAKPQPKPETKAPTKVEKPAAKESAKVEKQETKPAAKVEEKKKEKVATKEEPKAEPKKEKSAGFFGIFGKKSKPAEKPVEKKVEEPAAKPVEKKVEEQAPAKPVEAPAPKEKISLVRNRV